MPRALVGAARCMKISCLRYGVGWDNPVFMPCDWGEPRGVSWVWCSHVCVLGGGLWGLSLLTPGRSLCAAAVSLLTRRRLPYIVGCLFVVL